jgi:RHS repeat-associated protein
VILGAASLPQAAKRFSVGPTADWDYSTINDALAAQVPFTEDVILEVYMDPSGYNTKGIVEYSHLLGGYSLYITGVTDYPKAATYYVNEELEYEVPQSKTGVCRTTEYVKGADIIARRVTQGASASGNQFYVKNHLGSTIFLTNAAATTNIAEADYFPYGKKINLTTTPDHVTQTFTGKELDRYDEDMGEGEDGEGWYYFGARYYDADIGKWKSVDPTPQYVDLYNYCGGNPVYKKDLNGAWGSDFHYDKTVEIAVNLKDVNGNRMIDDAVAKQIAFHTNNFDVTHDPVNPYLNNPNRKYHFQSNGPAEYMKNKAILETKLINAAKTHDLVGYSGILHQLQDLDPHYGYDAIIGHALAGHAPDNMKNNPAKVEKSSEITDRSLRIWAIFNPIKAKN